MSLRMGILGLLRYAPMSGYSLKKAFDMSVNHFWPAKLSQIYRELGALERDGFVVSDIRKQETRPDRKMYTLTDRGREAFGEWIGTFPDPLEQPHRSELLLRVFFGSAMDRGLLIRELESLKTILERYRKQIRMDRVPEFLETVTAPETGENGATVSPETEAMYWKFTVRRFELTADATVRWADECIRELEEKS